MTAVSPKIAKTPAPQQKALPQTMRPSDPSRPDYGRLPIYRPGLRDVWEAAKNHYRVERIPTWALFGAAYSTCATLLNAGIKVDDRRHPGWRDQAIREPVFIVGNPRSGTTMLHRLMSFDEDTFSGVRLYQSTLPVVSAQKTLQALNRFDERTPGRPLRRFVDLINDKMFGGWDGIHKLGIDEHEEDEAFWAFSMMSITINLLVPYTEELPHLRWFDEADDEARAAQLDFYEGAIKRHLYATGPNKRFLNKNVFMTPRIRAIMERMPDARFLYLVRHPYEALPSFLSMWWEKWVDHQPDIRKDGPETLALARLAFDYYEHALDLLDEHEGDRIMVVRYDELTSDPFTKVSKIYDWLGTDMTPAFKQELRAFTSKQRRYESVHKYSLEDFGLDKGSVYLSAQRFCERFGFEP